MLRLLDIATLAGEDDNILVTALRNSMLVRNRIRKPAVQIIVFPQLYRLEEDGQGTACHQHVKTVVMPGNFKILRLAGVDIGHTSLHLARKCCEGFVVKGFQFIRNLAKYKRNIVKIPLL